MPRTKTDYSTTVIYVIRCDDFNITDEYIGSTTNFRRRKCEHKSTSTNESHKNHNSKLYKTMRENGGWDNWKIIQLEEYPCEDKRQAEAREEYWRKERQAKLNMVRPFVTEDEIKEQAKDYKLINRDKILEAKKEYIKIITGVCL
jgi:hypothetical protein